MRRKSNRWQRERMGGGNLVHLGGGEDEDDVLGRLLHDFEQGVKGPDAEHVGLVNDVDAVADLGGGEVCLSRSWRMLSTPLLLAASISVTSSTEPSSMPPADSAHPAGLPSCWFGQLTALR